MTDELDILVRRYLDGELPLEREPEVLRRMADDAEARALLRLELQVRAQAADPLSVPSGFADRVMSAVEAADVESAKVAQSPFDVLARFGRWLMAPRLLHVRPGLAAVAAVLLVAIAMSLRPLLQAGQGGDPAGVASPEPVATTVAEQEVVWARFMYADDEASSVAVAGDFSGWEPIPLSAQMVDGRTVWTGIVPVTKGEHQYMFVIDGSEWVTDPLAPVQRGDGFGNRNAVLQL